LDRRKKKDFWAKLLFSLNLLSWVILLFILLVFHRAQPEFETVFDRFYQLSLRTHWDIKYLNYLILLLFLGVVISLSGLTLGVFRGRRKKDHKKALIVTGILSFILLVFSNYII
jgi:hypothetical protein